MVITLEPGIYIPEEKLGVRIEDDVLVTDSGARILSDGLPREPDQIEAWLAERRGQTLSTPENRGRIAELNGFWRELERAVRAGDFEAYEATCHASGVLVAGASKATHPLASALAKWKPGFLKTKAGEMKADVEVRFSQRWGDATTAHETGIFRYRTRDTAGKETAAYVHFEQLLVKEGRWKTLMEYQKAPATPSEWERLTRHDATAASTPTGSETQN
jgi:hypothetical protein